MRQSIITIALAAMLVSRVASAAEGKVDSSKGGPGPGSTAAEPAGAGATGGAVEDTQDKTTPTKPEAADEKTWDVGAGLEYHHILATQNIANGANRNVNYYSLGGRWDITKNDRISVEMGVYQNFLVDQGQLSAQFDDIALSYSRRIVLPADMTLRISPSVSLPTSPGSQLAHVYAGVSLGASLSKKFGNYFTLAGSVRGRVLIAGSAEGGSGYTDAGISGYYNNGTETGGSASPNTLGALSLRASADLAMPFHTPLSLGVSAYTGYSWAYNVGTCLSAMTGIGQAIGMPTPASSSNSDCISNTVASATVNNQPMMQRYAYEISLHYQFPSLKGVKTDLGFTFAPLGDGTVGTTPVLMGSGAREIYGFYRQTAEVYAGLGIHY